MKRTNQKSRHVQPEHVRRKVAMELRKLATVRRFTDAERAEFARMAESWQRTLPQKNK
jgi:hypothetical protein